MSDIKTGDQQEDDYQLTNIDARRQEENPPSNSRTMDKQRGGRTDANMKGANLMVASMPQASFGLGRMGGGRMLNYDGYPSIIQQSDKKAPAMHYPVDNIQTDVPMKAPSSGTRPKPKNKTSNQTETTSTPIPQVELLVIPTLNNPFKKAQAISILTGQGTEAERKSRACNAWKHVAAIFDSLKPFVTFKPNPKKMKCKGSYTTPDRLSTTTFEAQVWKVDKSISGQQDPVYILEFRNKSLEGREAFRDLIRTTAGELKSVGVAKYYGNGIEIYTKAEAAPPVVVNDEFAMPSFGGALGMPSFSSMKRNQQQQPSQRKGPISLNQSQLDIWAKILKEQKFPTCVETLKLIAQCCQNDHNLKLLAKREEVLAAVCSELQSAIAPSACLNALTIAHRVLAESRDAFTKLIEHGLMSAVAYSLKMHSGTHKVGQVKVTRSAMIEETALNVLDTLREGVQQLNEQISQEVQKTLRVLSEDLSGKMKDKTHAKQLNSIIKGLRSKVQKSR